MIKVRMVLILGIWVIILPYLGFPSSWKDILSTLSGLGLVYLSYVFYKDYKIKNSINFDNFKENSDFEKNKFEENKNI